MDYSKDYCAFRIYCLSINDTIIVLVGVGCTLYSLPLSTGEDVFLDWKNCERIPLGILILFWRVDWACRRISKYQGLAEVIGQKLRYEGISFFLL